MAPALSIVVVAHGRRALTERCLASLDAALGARLGADVELVLVDNASPDDTGTLLDAWEERATVLRLPENRNFAGGYNAGARAATGDVLVLLNNDTVVPAGALEALAAQAADPTVGLVGVRLVYPDGTLQHGGFAWRRLAGRLQPFHLFHHEAGDLPAAGTSFDIDCVTGACVALRRDVFLGHDGFDEGYVNGWEDVDLCLRLRVAGLRVVYRGDVSVVHDEGATSGGHYEGADNVARFQARWGELLDEDEDRVRDLFDAGFGASGDPVRGVGRHPRGAGVVVSGPVCGLSPHADEARALLAALGRAAARDVAPTWVRPRLRPAEAAVVDQALARPAAPSAERIRVGGDRAGRGERPHALRLAGAPETPPDPDQTVWAACPDAAAAAVAAGADPARVHLLAPPVPAYAPGPGGDGVLVLLPAHDLARSRAVVAALPAGPVALLPTAATEELAALADGRPGARLLAPVASEAAFAALAGRFDVLVAADPRDGFGRRALTAAAVGTTPILLDAGPASWVLGAPVTPVAALADAVRTAPTGDRATLAGAVRAACAPEAAAAALDARLRAEARGPHHVPDARPGVLVVAAQPPTHDRDAGSLRLLRLLRILLEQGLHVTFVAQFAVGLERHLEDLEALGIEVYANDLARLGMGPSGVDLAAVLATRPYPVALITPFTMGETYLDELRALAPGTRLVVDTVDVHHVRERRAAELAGDRALLAAAERTRARERDVYARADALVAVSADERAVLEALVPGVPVGVIPTIHGPEATGDGFAAREGLLFVGAFAHPPNVDAALWLGREVLPRVRRELPGVPAWIVGRNPPPEVRALAGDGLEVTGWVPSTAPHLARARLSLAPLRYGAGVKGKIGEALAHGVPVVTTSVGTEGMGLADGEHVLVADDADAFAAAVVRAYRDRELWDGLRARGRALVLERFGPDVALRSWRALIGTPAAGPTTFVARPPAGDPAALGVLLRSYLGAFAPDDAVSLVVSEDRPPEATLARLAALVQDLGYDPAAIPDVAICPDPRALPRDAWRVSFDGGAPTGRVVAAGAPHAFRAALHGVG